MDHDVAAVVAPPCRPKAPELRGLMEDAGACRCNHYTLRLKAKFAASYPVQRRAMRTQQTRVIADDLHYLSRPLRCAPLRSPATQVVGTG